MEGKTRKGNKGIQISNTSKAQKRFIHLGQQMVWQLQETWALQVEFLHQFCTSREGRQQYLLGLHKFTPSLMHSHMVTCYRFFWGWAYLFAWFGAFSQHKWTLPY